MIAERAAWDYMETLHGEDKFDLCVVNPGLIIGPLLFKSECTSAQWIRMLLHREMSAVPKMSAFSIDVRDAATAHINAMKLDESTGKRHILVTSQMLYSDMAKIISKDFKPLGYNVPTGHVPSFIVRFMSYFDKSLTLMLAYLDVDTKFDQTRSLESY